MLRQVVEHLCGAETVPINYRQVENDFRFNAITDWSPYRYYDRCLKVEIVSTNCEAEKGSSAGPVNDRLVLFEAVPLGYVSGPIAHGYVTVLGRRLIALYDETVCQNGVSKPGREVLVERHPAASAPATSAISTSSLLVNGNATGYASLVTP